MTWRTGRRLPQKYYNASRDSCGNHFADVIAMAATFESLRVVLGFAFREDVEDGIESMLLIDNRHLPVDLLGPPPAGYLIGRAMNRYELAAMCRALGVVLPDSLAPPLSNRRA